MTVLNMIQTISRPDFAEKILSRYAAGAPGQVPGAELLFMRAREDGGDASPLAVSVQNIRLINQAILENTVLNLNIHLDFLYSVFSKSIRETHESVARHIRMLEKSGPRQLSAATHALSGTRGVSGASLTPVPVTLSFAGNAVTKSGTDGTQTGSAARTSEARPAAKTHSASTGGQAGGARTARRGLSGKRGGQSGKEPALEQLTLAYRNVPSWLLELWNITSATRGDTRTAVTRLLRPGADTERIREFALTVPVLSYPVTRDVMLRDAAERRGTAIQNARVSPSVTALTLSAPAQANGAPNQPSLPATGQARRRSLSPDASPPHPVSSGAAAQTISSVSARRVTPAHMENPAHTESPRYNAPSGLSADRTAAGHPALSDKQSTMTAALTRPAILGVPAAPGAIPARADAAVPRAQSGVSRKTPSSGEAAARTFDSTGTHLAVLPSEAYTRLFHPDDSRFLAGRFGAFAQKMLDYTQTPHSAAHGNPVPVMSARYFQDNALRHLSGITAERGAGGTSSIRPDVNHEARITGTHLAHGTVALYGNAAAPDVILQKGAAASSGIVQHTIAPVGAVHKNAIVPGDTLHKRPLTPDTGLPGVIKSGVPDFTRAARHAVPPSGRLALSEAATRVPSARHTAIPLTVPAAVRVSDTVAQTIPASGGTAAIPGRSVTRRGSVESNVSNTPGAAIVYRREAETRQEPPPVPPKVSSDIEFIKKTVKQSSTVTQTQKVNTAINAPVDSVKHSDALVPLDIDRQVNVIADKVYSALERRLRSEHMRKGLL